eukprot:5389465-Pyramimonas_sp.AAC.1
MIQVMNPCKLPHTHIAEAKNVPRRLKMVPRRPKKAQSGPKSAPRGLPTQPQEAKIVDFTKVFEGCWHSRMFGFPTLQDGSRSSQNRLKTANDAS